MTHPLDRPKPFDDCPSIGLNDHETGRAVKMAEEKELKMENYQSFDVSHRSYVGFEGEFAFAKYYDLGSPRLYKEGGDKYDFEVHSNASNSNVTIDVKTITYPEGDMLIQKSRYEELSYEEEAPDAYCLIEKRSYMFGIVGFILSEDVKYYDVYPSGEYSPVSVYLIPREDLSPAPDPSNLEPVT